ncbi:MAG: right-handed parallel beta-helix repeat-containing protein [Chthoniobacteraceae bacterium]
MERAHCHFKPLTLEGAGWGKTQLTVEEPPGDEIAKAYEEGDAAVQAATTLEPKDQALIGLIRSAHRPAIFVHSTDGVKVRGLRVQGASTAGPDSALTISTLVYFFKTKAAMADCVVAGPFGQGIRIGGGADVEIRHTLVAAVWDTGITVLGQAQGDTRPASRLHLIESDVRNVYHYGIAIGAGCDSTVVERCRISGTAWHGIRYDNASPTVTGNAIFSHARFGIYASGKTQATVRGNLFWKNEMAGVGCWFEDSDTIEGNSFIGNLRSGLEVLGGGEPVVTRNLFAGNPVAIACGAVAGRNGQTSAIGDPQLGENLFYENPVVLQVGEEKKPAPEGSLNTDPMFRDAAKDNFALAASSPARAGNIGVADPLTFAGPWPVLPEEKAIIPGDETRDSRSWTVPAAPKRSQAAEKAAAQSATEAKSWVADAFQLDDAAKREAAIERIRAAMTSGDVESARAGATAFLQLGPIEFDKASFRPAVRALLASEDIPTRAAAASAFTITGADAEDLPRIFALADDPAEEVRDKLTFVIVRLTNADLTGKEATEAILKLMAKLPRDSRSVAHAMWGVKLSPEIEAKVLEFVRGLDHASNGDVGYNFFYGTLSTQANKSEASCQRLIELLAHPDTTNVAGRSAWGLQQGVSRPEFPLVADAMMKVLEARSDGYLRGNALRCLRSYGSATQAPALKALLAKPGVTGDFRKTLDETLTALEARPAVGAASQPASAISSKEPPSPTARPIEKAEIEVEWKGKWWSATVLKKEGERTQIHYVGYGSEWDEWVTPERIRQLNGVAGQPAKTEEEEKKADEVARLVQRNRQAARLRAADDRQIYQPEELAEIESLYQVANRNWRTDEARASLKKLLEKYDRANRTGCATLYMGQMSTGQERLDYLTRAVEKFSDCYYFNGCQVGGYGRYVLALTLWETGEKEKARVLLEELKTTYKDATDHNGSPMGEAAEAVERELAG